MSEKLYPIVALPEIEVTQPLGLIGEMQVIPISKLVVDVTFQRSVSLGSVRNIRKICQAFDWAKFLPVIVVADGKKYSIVDGQHRTIAAASIGIKDVPCYVLSCNAAEAAAAFAAINGNVTPMQPIDLWFADLAAKSPKAVALKRVLDAAGVTVTRKKEGFLAGETRSIGVLLRAMEFYGNSVLTTILQCIVETGEGNPGMLTGAVINGIGRAIRTKPELLTNPSKLFQVFDGISISTMLYDAGVESAFSGNPIQFIITRQINQEIRQDVDAGKVADAA